MEPPVSISKRSSTLLTGSVAGLIGGLVEFGWVTLYADITGEDPHQFAPGIVSACVQRVPEEKSKLSRRTAATAAPNKSDEVRLTP